MMAGARALRRKEMAPGTAAASATRETTVSTPLASLSEVPPTSDVEASSAQPAAQIGDDLSAKAMKAKARVAKEAEEKFGGDYQAAYLALRRDPTLWADYNADSAYKSGAKSYVYLPSYEADPQPLNLSVGFELYVPVDMPESRTADYPTITMAKLVKALDSDSAARILRATNAAGATVTIDAVLAMDTFASANPTPRTEKTTVTIQKIALADVTDTRTDLIPAGTAELGWTGSISTKMFRLTGTVTAAGTEAPGLEMLPQVGGTKEKAVRAAFP